jgi:hypothetical protein
MQALHETDFWDPASFRHVWLGLFATISYENVLPELLQDVDLHTGVRAWSIHDDAPPRFLAIREFLNNVFPGQLIRTSGTNSMGCSFPDLSHLDFYLYGHMKSAVCTSDVSDVQDVQQRIQNELVTIRTTPGIFRQVRRSLFRRAMSSVEAQSGHLEHFL